MKIACLGWGSLTWNHDFQSDFRAWKENGPRLPIEFARVENSGELTSVICMDAPLIQVMWSLLEIDTLENACEKLRECEGISKARFNNIGSMLISGPEGGSLSQWGADKQIDALIWIALPPKFEGTEGRLPSLDEALSYLSSLTGEAQARTRQIIGQTPRQISTNYRCAIAKKFGWE